MDASMKKDLQKIACKVRMGVIEGTYNAKSGHPGGSLSKRHSDIPLLQQDER